MIFLYTPCRDIVKRLFMVRYISLLFLLFGANVNAIPAAEYFQSFGALTAELSPSGAQVAIIEQSNGSNVLSIFDAQKRQKKPVLDTLAFAGEKAYLHSIYWVDDTFIAARFSEQKKGIKEFIDTKRYYSTILINTQASTLAKPSVIKIKTPGWLVDPLYQEEGQFLFSKQGAYSKIYRLSIDKLSQGGAESSKLRKIDGGQFTKKNEIIALKGYVTRWFLNETGVPQAALKYNDKAELELITLKDDGSTAEVLNSWFDKDEDGKQESSPEKLLIPIAYADGSQFYCLDILEEEERNIYLVDYKTQSEDIVYTVNAYNIKTLLFSPFPRKLIGARLLKNGYLQDVFFDNAGKLDQKVINKLDVELDISPDKHYSLMYKESYDQPGQYILKDNRANTELTVASLYPQLDSKLSGSQISAKVISGDLSISYLLNQPNRIDAKPLIVMPHGGPVGVHDTPYFDLFTQYFVSQNYAVLRVNFRGSSGYSKAFEDAGKGEWGKLMLDDIHTAAVDVVKNNNIDASKVCLFGASYGGYAALMLAIKHPNFYRCSVSVAGLTDLNLQIHNTKHSERTQNWYNEQLLSDNKDEALDWLNTLSPAYLVDKLQIPVMIAHGKQDQVVDFEHAFRIKLMLEKYQKPYEWLLMDDAGHHFEKDEHKQHLFTHVSEFIATQINSSNQ